MLEHIYHYHCPYDSPIHCVYTAKTAELHRHVDFYEFCIFSNGLYLNVEQGSQTPCSTSHLLFYRPGSAHELIMQKPGSEHFSIIIREDYFEKHFRRYCDTHISYSSLTELPDKISMTLSGSQAIYLSKLASVVAYSISPEHFSIKEHLLDTLLFTCLEQLPVANDVVIDKFVNNLMLTYDSYNQLDANISDLCAQYPASKRTILERFKILNHCTIVEYRHKRRMEYAAHLLQKENCSIARISNLVGFSCPSFFAKQFKEFYGITPKQYQSIHQKSSAPTF